MPAPDDKPEIALALDRLAEAIVITDAAGVGSYINPAARALLGDLPAFDASVPVRQIDWGAIDSAGHHLGPDELPSEHTRITGQELSGVDVGVPTRNGDVRWLRVNTRRLGDGGPPCAVIGSYVDVSEQKAAEAGLREANERFETSFVHAPTGFALLSFAGRIERVNETLCAMLGREESELVGLTSAQITHPDDLDLTAGAFAQLRAGGGPVSLEKRFVRPDGEVVWALTRAASVLDGQGEPTHIVAHIQDLTALKLAEASRTAATELFETAFTSAPIGLMLIGLDMKVIRVNERICEILGRGAEELVGAEMRTFTHPDDLGVTAGAWQHLQTEGTPISVQKRYLRPDGEVVWVQTYGRAVPGSAQAPGYIISHLFDITEGKRAELEHAAMTAQFEAAFSDGPIGMAVVGLDGHWLRVNRMLCQLLGYSEAELLALSFQDITHPDDLDTDLDLVARLLAGEIERYTMQKRYLTASAREVWATLAVSLVRDPDGRPLHFISQIEDISDRKRLEAELRHQADHDPLTEIWNRRRFDEALDQQILRSQRYGETAALLSIDLNEFKAVNDRNGHATGDAVLRAVTAALRSRVRVTDGLARVGGDEFAVLLANVTEAEARALADALRETVASAVVMTPAGPLRITASIGVGMIDSRSRSRTEVLAEADAAMYWHKQGSGAPASDPQVRGEADGLARQPVGAELGEQITGANRP